MPPVVYPYANLNPEQEYDRYLNPMQHAQNVIYYNDGKNPELNTNFIVTAAINSPITWKGLVKSLFELMGQHPVLNATLILNENGHPVFVTSSSSELPVRWLNYTTPAEVEAVKLEELRTSIPYNNRLWRLTVMIDPVNPTRTVSIMTFHHAIGDGASTIRLQKELYERVRINSRDPRVNADVSFPEQSLEGKVSPELVNKFQDTHSTTSYVTLLIPKEQTQALHDKKPVGYTIDALWTGFLVSSYYQTLGEKETTANVGTAVNMRNRMNPSIADEVLKPEFTFLERSFSLNPQTTLVGLIKESGDNLKSQLNSENHIKAVETLKGTAKYVTFNWDMFKQYYSMPPGKILISNVKADPSPAIEEMDIIVNCGPLCTDKNLVVNITTYGGDTSISMSYNPLYVPHQFAQGVRAQLSAQVQEFLKV